MAISVLIADDHTLVRDMLSDRLASDGIVIAGLAATGDHAAELAAVTKPDVVVLDIDMPGLSAFEAARAVQEASPQSRVIFLSAFVTDRYVDQALSVEASGYLTKTESPAAVAAAIRKVDRGASAFSPAVLDRIVISPDGARIGSRVRSRCDLLTGRECEVLGYVARGLSQKQIARQADISVKTVQHHVMNLMEKLDIHDRVELARFAIREGIVEA